MESFALLFWEDRVQRNTYGLKYYKLAQKKHRHELRMTKMENAAMSKELAASHDARLVGGLQGEGYTI